VVLDVLRLQAFDPAPTDKEAIMPVQPSIAIEQHDEGLKEASRWAGAFLAGFSSSQTRKAYRRDLDCWFSFCARHQVHPFRGVRRTFIEVYLRELEAQDVPPAAGTLYRRVSTLSSWFRWLEDEDVMVGNPAARIRRPSRHSRPQPWLNRNQLTDLLAVAEDEGGDSYALVCLLGLNCSASIADLGGSRYQPMLRIVGKGDKPAEVVLNPRTQQAIDQAIPDRRGGPLLRNEWQRRMQPHNAAAILRRLATAAGIAQRVTPPRPALFLHHYRTAARRAATGDATRCPTRQSDTDVAYDQSERSFHKDPTFVLMAATAR
jgi:site-specific recombinase XerD